MGRTGGGREVGWGPVLECGLERGREGGWLGPTAGVWAGEGEGGRLVGAHCWSVGWRGGGREVGWGPVLECGLERGRDGGWLGPSAGVWAGEGEGGRLVGAQCWSVGWRGGGREVGWGPVLECGLERGREGGWLGPVLECGLERGREGGWLGPSAGVWAGEGEGGWLG